MYLFTVFVKVAGKTWANGTAVGYALQLWHYTRVPVPQTLIDSLVVINVMTWGTLLIELAIAILVWNRRLRPWVLAAGIALHLSIELTIKVGFFSWAVLVTYIAFVPEDTMSRWILRVRDRLDTHRHVGISQPAELERA
jgi:signal transduction histidine kinase